MLHLEFLKATLLQKLDPAGKFSLGLENAWIFLYIALLQIPPANTACSLGGRGGFTLRILTCLSPKTSARDKGSIHYISSWPQVSHTKWFSQALLIHLSTNVHRAPRILFSFNPRSRALAQHFRAFCQKLGLTAPGDDGEADGQHADTEADSWLNKRLSGITRIPRAKPPLSLRGFWNVFADMFQVILLRCHCHVLHCRFARLQWSTREFNQRKAL